MQKIRNYFLAFIVVSLSACSSLSDKRLDTSAAQTVGTVSVSEIAVRPAEVYYKGLEDAVGMGVGGVVGSLISEVDSGKKGQLSAFIRKNKIDVSERFVREFNAGLSETKRFSRVIDRAQSDAHFELNVVQYGMVKSFGFTNMQTYLKLNVKLILADGSLLWEKTVEDLGNDKRIPKQPIALWYAYPEQFNDAYQVQTENLVKELISDLTE